MTEADRVMLDIETVGTEPGCAILSIGAVRFNAAGIADTFHMSVSMQSCQRHGLTIDAETLDWWLHCGDEAQEVLTGGQDLPAVLQEFASWYGDADEVWANSPSFDCAIVEAACECAGVDAPWHYYDQRDFRTLKNLPVAAEIEHDGTEHDALDDARYQAKVALETLNRMQGREAALKAIETEEEDDDAVQSGSAGQWTLESTARDLVEDVAEQTGLPEEFFHVEVEPIEDEEYEKPNENWPDVPQYMLHVCVDEDKEVNLDVS